MNIQSVTGGIYITTSGDENFTVTRIAADNLTSVGSSNSSQSTHLPQEDVGLTITGFPSLTDLAFPALETIQGGLNISSNPDILILNFSSLVTVGGNLDLTGNFTRILLPNLKSVGESILVESTEASINCGRKIGDILRGVNYGGVSVCAAGIESPRPWPMPTYDASAHTGSFAGTSTSTATASASRVAGRSSIAERIWSLSGNLSKH